MRSRKPIERYYVVQCRVERSVCGCEGSCQRATKWNACPNSVLETVWENVASRHVSQMSVYRSIGFARAAEKRVNRYRVRAKTPELPTRILTFTLDDLAVLTDDLQAQFEAAERNAIRWSERAQEAWKDLTSK